MLAERRITASLSLAALQQKLRLLRRRLAFEYCIYATNSLPQASSTPYQRLSWHRQVCSEASPYHRWKRRCIPKRQSLCKNLSVMNFTIRQEQRAYQEESGGAGSHTLHQRRRWKASCRRKGRCRCGSFLLPEG